MTGFSSACRWAEMSVVVCVPLPALWNFVYEHTEGGIYPPLEDSTGAANKTSNA